MPNDCDGKALLIDSNRQPAESLETFFEKLTDWSWFNI